MVGKRVMTLAPLVLALLAGCSDSDEPSLRSVYGDDAKSFDEIVPDGVDVPDDFRDIVVIDGYHIEGRIGNGTWTQNVTASYSESIVGPIMDASSPPGGGGETTPLSGTAWSAEARIIDGGRLDGYRVLWTTGAFEPGENVSDSTVLDGDESYTFDLGFGRTEVTAVLYKGDPASGAMPAGVFMEGVTFVTSAEYVITGEVQPVRPGGIGAPTPSVTDRMEMVDVYVLELPAGTPVTAATTFNGMQGDGTDIDLGWYDPQGTGVQCVGAGGGTATVPLVPDPAQAMEQLVDMTTSAGAWSIQVGAMADGCSDLPSWYYNNHAPVPYELTISIGDAAPAGA